MIGATYCSLVRRMSTEDVYTSILWELVQTEPYAQRAADLRDKIMADLQVSQQTFYTALSKLSKRDWIYRKKEGREYTVTITEAGKKAFIELRRAERVTAVEPRDIRPQEAFAKLTTNITTLLGEVQNQVRELVKRSVHLSKTRVSVWDALGDLYKRADHELLIMGKGADVSHPQVKEDIRHLMKNTEEFVSKERSEYTRIQPVNTWTTWLQFLRDIKRDSVTGLDRANVKVYLIDEQPEFVPQLNIKDSNELILVPLEEDPDRAHCFHVFDSRLINNHRLDFMEREKAISGVSATSKFLDIFVENAKKLREMQSNLLVAVEYDRQCKFWTGPSGSRSVPKMTYEEAQGYFPVDWEMWKNMFIERANARDKLGNFCSSKRKEGLDHGNLETDFSLIFENTVDENAVLGVANIPKFFRDALGLPVVEMHLKRTDIRDAARDLIRHLSEAVLSKIFQSLMNELT